MLLKFKSAYLTTEELYEINLNKVLFILTQSVVPFHHIIAYYCKSMVKICTASNISAAYAIRQEAQRTKRIMMFKVLFKGMCLVI